eukprot:scaffold84427_cov35-Attheya_sp.AAC.1
MSTNWPPVDERIPHGPGIWPWRLERPMPKRSVPTLTRTPKIGPITCSNAVAVPTTTTRTIV